MLKADQRQMRVKAAEPVRRPLQDKSGLHQSGAREVMKSGGLPDAFWGLSDPHSNPDFVKIWLSTDKSEGEASAYETTT